MAQDPQVQARGYTVICEEPVNIGREQDGVLYESFLGAMTDDVEAMKMWRRFKKR